MPETEPNVPRTKLFDDLIRYMRTLGWDDERGPVVHPSTPTQFPTWLEAMKACVDLASE